MNKFELKRGSNVFVESYSMSNFKIQISNQCQISND